MSHLLAKYVGRLLEGVYHFFDIFLNVIIEISIDFFNFMIFDFENK